MINAQQLLADLTRQLKGLEADLRQRIAEQASLNDSLRAEWQAALDAKRCAETFETWADQVITQAGVHWLLSCVFLRFIEDNQLVDRPWLAGTPASGRLALARDRHEAYFRTHPLQSDRDYLLAAFREAGTLPGLHTFFDEAHNPAFRLGISGDAAMALRQFWQQVDTDTGLLLRDFTDPAWNTRFLGDLYQDLSEATRKRYALLQTPEFVEEFILDRTLTPAIREFGFRDVRMIDPTCGSGHFLLGGFARVVAEWQRHEPGRNPSDLAQKALSAVAGVDLNPFAVAISRFRLLVAALQIAGVHRLANAPNFQIEVAIGDSLLHGTRFGMTGTQSLLGDDQFVGTGLAHAYASEDLAKVQRILNRQYHAVVGNPPYIVVKDAALNTAYRNLYASCHKKYSLGCPFTERFFELGVSANADSAAAGFIGLITTNAFMKRDYGAKLVESVLPRVDLTHVVDTAKAHIPDHGTPTVILFGRSRPPVDKSVRMVIGVRAEAEKPKIAAEGLVWNAIRDQVDKVGSSSAFASSIDVTRKSLAKHPWSLGTEATTALKALMGKSGLKLGAAVSVAGVFGMTNADEALISPRAALSRRAVESRSIRPLVVGDQVRDWGVDDADWVIFPYENGRLIDLLTAPGMSRWLWPCRTVMGSRATFDKKTYFEEGRPWWGWHQVALDRMVPRRTIALAFLATNNQFALVDADCVFGRTAPILKLPHDTSDPVYFGLLGAMNSSIMSFWLKHTLMDRGGGGIGGGLATEAWELFYEHDTGKLKRAPLPSKLPSTLAARLCEIVNGVLALAPAKLIEQRLDESGFDSSAIRHALNVARVDSTLLLEQAIAHQEELDWQCYYLYGVMPPIPDRPQLWTDSPPPVKLGERAFEIALARRVAAGTEETTWFERHGATPVTEIPPRWPEEYRRLIQGRIDIIERDGEVALVEQIEFKRRWNTSAWKDLEQAALRNWLLDRLEQPAFWPTRAGALPELTSTNRLAELARSDAAFMQMAAVYAGFADFDPARLVAELVAAEAVPLLPVHRYTDDGLRKRAQWEDTWVLQRREDAIDAEIDRQVEARRQELMTVVTEASSGARPEADALAWVQQELDKAFIPLRKDRKAREVGPIPVPPKYKGSDFLRTTGTDYWGLRGGLDVPKERFVSFPGAERGADGSLVIAWAGWNHLQLASALFSYYTEMKDNEGWEPARLQPLLAGLLELVPWLEQWHNDLDPESGQRLGTYYRGVVTEDARALGFTLDDLRAWKPAVVAAKRGRRRAS